MQLCLFECALVDWLGYAFCMARAIFGGSVISWDRFHDLLSVLNMMRKISCIVRKGECIVRRSEKQIQILDGY
jgi:hypothetical protein